MKNLMIGGLGVFMAVCLSGCAIAGGGQAAVAGGLYAGYKAPGTFGTGTGTKTGEACAMSILGIVGIGDASITAAKAAGGITQVSHTDHDNMSILGIYGKTCTIVTGQ